MGHPTVLRWLWSAVSAAVGNCGAKVEWERKGGNSERNHEKCGAWKCLPWFMAAQPGFQEKHVFKFNLRCFPLFFFLPSSSSTPNCWQEPGFESKAKMLGNCDHVKKALNNVAFWKCGDSFCTRGSDFSAGEHVWYLCSCRKALSTSSIQKIPWFTQWWCIYWSLMWCERKGIEITQINILGIVFGDLNFTCSISDINSGLALWSVNVHLTSNFSHTLL